MKKKRRRRREETFAEMLRRTLDFDVFVCVRCGGRRRVLAGREGSGRSASNTGAPGSAHGRCELGPGARARPERVVLRLEPP
jgi:hypothetical protein